MSNSLRPGREHASGNRLRPSRTSITSRTGRAGKGLLALVVASAALVVLPATTAVALTGTSVNTPAESNIAEKSWVTASATDGDAAQAVDGDLQTAWIATSAPATLSVDLGGTYDAVHKVGLTFAGNTSVYRYRLLGSTDGQAWSTLADRSENASYGGIFTDLFDFKGLHYVKLQILSGAPVGVRELSIVNYLRPDMDNGSDTSEQGSNTNAYYYNAGNNPPVPGVRGGRFTDPNSIATGNNFFGLTKDLGWDTIRLRVWNEPKNETNGNPVTTAGNNSPENTRRVAKAVTGAGQNLAIDLHYADSWADPQNQPKPYSWANLSFADLTTTTYQYTYDFLKSLVDQGTTPTIVGLGNEITNGMMWGSEYDKITPYVHHHDYYTSGKYLGAPGGGIKWLKYEEANGDVNSPAYHEFLDSVDNLSQLIDAGNRAVKQLNADMGTHIETELHFAFNIYEQPTTGGKISLDPVEVSKKVMTLIKGLSTNLKAKGGMVDRIGLSYYPDWHGTYAQVQQTIVDISKILPGIKFNIAECSPKASGTVTNALDNPNHPVGFKYSVQSQGDDTMDIMKLINDVPNNVGTGVWPWAGTQVYGSGSGANATLNASFKVWNSAFAKNVVESSLYSATGRGVAPALPATVRSLDLTTGVASDVPVVWNPIDPGSYATTGTFAVTGTAQVSVPAAGRGVAMTAVVATVDVVDPSTTSITLARNAVATTGDLAVSSTVTAPVPFSGTAVLYDGTTRVATKAVVGVSSGGSFSATAEFREAGSGLATGRRQYSVAFESGTDHLQGSHSAAAAVDVYFFDKAPGSSFYNEVQWLAGSGITTGVDGGGFDPTGLVTRQAMAAFLFRMTHPGVTVTPCTVKPFPDVAVGSPFCGEIAWLRTTGITNGYAGGLFQPNSAVDRQAMAAFLFRLTHPGTAAPVCGSAPFADVTTGNQFCGEITWLRSTGITTGYDGNTFHPAEKVSRQAMAAFLYRLAHQPA
ncbi:hypothetical protein D1871_01425 [Nakamurella silvestris]|nr:hypothetical protein D1871_01425 [Nakamurella silvestris]